MALLLLLLFFGLLVALTMNASTVLVRLLFPRRCAFFVVVIVAFFASHILFVYDIGYSSKLYRTDKPISTILYHLAVCCELVIRYPFFSTIQYSLNDTNIDNILP